MKLSPYQNLLLLSLAAHYPDRPKQSEFDNKQRNPLCEAGYIELEQVGRPKLVGLTDKGWSYLAEHRDLVFSNSKLSGTSLAALHTRLHDFFHRSGHAFADLFRETANPDPLSKAEETIPAAIRRAYLVLTDNRLHIDVRLQHLKAHLQAFDPATLDYCLMGLVMAGLAQVRQIDDSLAIDERDRATSLEVGGTTRHLFRLIS